MPSKWFTFTGKAMWVKNKTPDPEYKNYKLNLYLDEKNMELLKKSGVQLQPKEDDGGTFVTFRRPESKVIKDELVKFGPPKTIDTEGNPFEEDIGNGSIVDATIVVYETRRGPGHRLEEIKVREHVPYTRRETAADTPSMTATIAKAKNSNAAVAANSERPF